ncbi:hypothetical protein HDU78_011258 [Chytriomyces hyalinus]|nr:hypothetical protein HDU78_011258 [Chytriomyces hyalinus]
MAPVHAESKPAQQQQQKQQDTAVTQPLPHLENAAYIHYDPIPHLGATPEEIRDFEKLLKDSFKGLPCDPYCSDGRFKVYSRSVVIPWESKQVVRECPPYENVPGIEHPAVPYNQGAFNPECEGLRRWYKPVPSSLINHPLFQRLILMDVSLCDWNEDEKRHPILVGIHLNKITATKDRPVGVVTPNFLHQDGHKFSFVHLIDRVNCVGGENFISAVLNAGESPHDVDPSEIMDRFYMYNFLETFGVYDDKCSHHAEGITRENTEMDAERLVIVFDIEPMAPLGTPL